MNEELLKAIVSQFQIEGTVAEIVPLGNGLINDTLKVVTVEDDKPDYVLQRINNAIFTDVPLLQQNIERVTSHLRGKGQETLTFIPVHGEGSASAGTFFHDSDTDTYWRLSVFIPDTVTINDITPATSYDCGRAFARFEAQLVDLPESLGETIPDFHNMELRLQQLQESIAADAVGRVGEVQDILDDLLPFADEMTKAERLHREGRLPKRVCHCDTKVNNMLFDEQGRVRCVIDLDTVMPGFIFSDYGDFLRTAANTVAEDADDYDAIHFRMDIFKAFTRGYIEASRSFLTPLEIALLPYAAALFPYMQCVRFLTDYINGDTYYKIMYPRHNLVRTLNQQRLFHEVLSCQDEMRAFINALTGSFRVLTNAPWFDAFPYKPHVEVSLSSSGDALSLHFRVKENTVRAVAPHDNGRVWEDSCCEFFVQVATPGDADNLKSPDHAAPSLYYNFECNAAGTLLIGCGPAREGRELAPPEVLQQVARWSSLGCEPFDEKPAPDEWELTLRIPATALWHHRLTSFDHVTLRGNVYKCGDKLQQPHFLSLFPIPISKPDFHRPDFFREITFE